MNSKIETYIEKQQSPQKDICRRLWHLITDTFPGIGEEMKWGVPAFGDGKFYIVALKTHVNLGFSLERMTPEEGALFDGSGKTMKHIEVHSPEGIDEERIVRLLRMVMEK